jgi:hypothetical protein
VALLFAGSDQGGTDDGHIRLTVRSQSPAYEPVLLAVAARARLQPVPKLPTARLLRRAASTSKSSSPATPTDLRDEWQLDHQAVASLVVSATWI